MRKLLALAILLILHATPVFAVTWGPGGAASTGSPEYTRPIRVVDTFIGTINVPHRDEWRRARNQALREWKLPFTVERMSESALPYLYDKNIGATGIDGMVIPNAILIVRDHSGCNFQGGYSTESNGGIAIFCNYPFPGWWSTRYSSLLRSVAAHEYGHALGFGHGGNGVMGGAALVNDEERSLARAYYAEVWA